MPKYEVTIPWNGVIAGQVIDLDSVHPAIAANVRPVAEREVDATSADDAEQVLLKVREQADGIVREAQAKAVEIIDTAKAEAARLTSEATKPAGQLTTAITTDAGERRELIKARLKELKIEFDGRKGEDDLAALLPEGELAKLFPAE